MPKLSWKTLNELAKGAWLNLAVPAIGMVVVNKLTDDAVQEEIVSWPLMLQLALTTVAPLTIASAVEGVKALAKRCRQGEELSADEQKDEASTVEEEMKIDQAEQKEKHAFIGNAVAAVGTMAYNITATIMKNPTVGAFHVAAPFLGLLGGKVSEAVASTCADKKTVEGAEAPSSGYEPLAEASAV